VQDARHIGGHKRLAFAHADDHRGPKRAATILSGSAADRTPNANAPVSRLTAGARRLQEEPARESFSVVLHLLNQMGDDLGVGFRDELVAFSMSSRFRSR